MEEVRELKNCEIAYFYNANNNKENIGKSCNAIIRVDSNNYLHSFNDEPSAIYYYDYEINSNINSMYWLNHGRKHRLFGPAYIGFHMNNIVREKGYYINNEELTQEEWETEVNRINLLNEI